MKKLITTLVAVCIMYGVSAQGIEFFHGTYEEALKKAQTEKKQIFVDVYTSWCGPCKMMAKNVFPDKKVGAYFNAHFVCLQLDAEKETGHVFFQHYKANGFPSFFWLNAQGKLLDVQCGYTEPDRFLELARAAETSDLARRLEEGEKRWANGERTPELVNEYVIENLGRVNAERVKPLILEYLEGLNDIQLKQEENYRIMRMFMREAGDHFIFRTLLNYAEVYQQYEKNYAFWINMYRMVVRSGILLRNNPEKYRKYLHFLENLESPLASMYCEILNMEYRLFQKDFSAGIPEATAIIAKYEEEHPYLSGQFLYTLIITGYYQEQTTDEKLADQVIAWSDKALQVIPSKENLLYLAASYARKENYKKAYELMTGEPFFPEPILSNALYKYLNLPVVHRQYLK